MVVPPGSVYQEASHLHIKDTATSKDELWGQVADEGLQYMVVLPGFVHRIPLLSYESVTSPLARMLNIIGFRSAVVFQHVEAVEAVIIRMKMDYHEQHRELRTATGALEWGTRRKVIEGLKLLWINGICYMH